MTDPESIADITQTETFQRWVQRGEEFQNLSPEEQSKIIETNLEEENQRWHDQNVVPRLNKIPTRFYRARLSDHPEAHEWFQAFLADRQRKGLLICGPTGVGKTHLMWAIYRALAEMNGPSMRVVKIVRLLSALRPGSDEDAALDRMLSVSLLGLDDVGAQKDSEWVQERLYEIIDTRYDEGLPLLVTSNRKAELLEETVGERVASRLAEACDVLTLTGPDRRRA